MTTLSIRLTQVAVPPAPCFIGLGVGRLKDGRECAFWGPSVDLVLAGRSMQIGLTYVLVAPEQLVAVEGVLRGGA